MVTCGTHERIISVGLCPEVENEASWWVPGFSSDCMELLGCYCALESQSPSPSRSCWFLCCRFLCTSSWLPPQQWDCCCRKHKTGLSVNDLKAFSRPPVEVAVVRTVPLWFVPFSPQIMLIHLWKNAASIVDSDSRRGTLNQSCSGNPSSKNTPPNCMLILCLWCECEFSLWKVGSHPYILKGVCSPKIISTALASGGGILAFPASSTGTGIEQPLKNTG